MTDGKPNKWRIAQEVHIRTALEDPGFAEREFEKWKAEGERWRARESHVTAWAKVAWVAEGKVIAMGRDLGKVSRRLGKQREINREQRERIMELRGLLAKNLGLPPPEKHTRASDERIRALEKALEWYAYQESFAQRHGRWDLAPGVRVARDALEGKEEE